MVDSGDPTVMFHALMDMHTLYLEKGSLYSKVETKWRRTNFVIAIWLGVLPVCQTVAELLPGQFRLWIRFGITFFNVAIVVLLVKLDLGEKIADASMGHKTFNKLASNIDVFICQLRCAPGVADPTMLLNGIKITLDTIEGQLRFPIAEKRFRKLSKKNAQDKHDAIGNSIGLSFTQGQELKKSMSKIQPEANFDTIVDDSMQDTKAMEKSAAQMKPEASFQAICPGSAMQNGHPLEAHQHLASPNGYESLSQQPASPNGDAYHFSQHLAVQKPLPARPGDVIQEAGAKRGVATAVPAGRPGDVIRARAGQPASATDVGVTTQHKLQPYKP